MLNTIMLQAIKKWWETLGEYEQELAKQGIYNCNNQLGYPIYIETPKNDRQEINKQSTKESKRKR